MRLSWIIQGLLEERGKKVRVRERDVMTEGEIRKREKDLKMLLCTTSPKVEGAMSPGMQATSRSWRMEGKGFSLEPPKELSSADTVTLAQKELLWTSDFQNCPIINVCCSMPPNFW